MFFVRTKEGGGTHFDPPPANSETKEARTMKVSTVTAYYINSITKQLKFLNFYCSIVCSCCSVVWLITKNELKMIEFSSSFKLNEIHAVDNPFNEDPKNVILFPRDVLISGEGSSENLGKMGNNRDIYCYANRWVVNFEREYKPLSPGAKILVMPQFSYMPDQILGKKLKNSIFRPKLTFL